MQIESLLERMNLEEKVGQMLHLRVLEDKRGWPSDKMHEAISRFKPGAVRIYGQHTDPFFLTHYTNQLQQWSRQETEHGIPLIVAADCEAGAADIAGGNVQNFPYLRGRTATGSKELAEEISMAVAEDTLAMGLNMIQQPTVDINTQKKNPVIGVRAAGETEKQVIPFTKALIRGAKKKGAVTVAKHFPGHGATAWDSHLKLARVDYPRKVLDRHLSPFRAAIETGVEAVMTAHIIVSCIDPNHVATLSHRVLTGLLREEMGFEGLIITDGMTMRAVTDHHSPGRAAAQAVKAGNDLILASGDFDFQTRTRRGIMEAVLSGEISEERINSSVLRILTVKSDYGLFEQVQKDPLTALSVTENRQRRKLAYHSYLRSFTANDAGGILPLKAQDTVLVTGVKEVAGVTTHLNTTGYSAIGCHLNSADPENEWNPDRQDIQKTLSLSQHAEVALVVSYSHHRLPPGQRELISALSGELPTVIIALGLPYGYGDFEQDAACIQTYLQNRWGRPSPFPRAAVKALIDLLYEH